MKDLLLFVARSLVSDPDAVTVTEKEREDAIVLELRVGKGDIGKVIGKNGRIAKAIRTLVRSGNASTKKKIYVDII